MKKQLGFNLVEILIVIAMLSILASVTLPLYSQYMIKTKRAAAENVLLKAAVALEHYHLEENTYLGATIEKLNLRAIVEHAYHIYLRQLTDTNYLLLAEPIGKQAVQDKLCGTLMLNGQGEKSISGEGKLASCW